MQNKLSIIKNMIWAVCIVICLAALLIGIITAAVSRYDGDQEDGILYLSGKPPEKTVDKASETPAENASSMQGNGSLNTLPESSDGGQNYIDTLTFLCDSSLIGLRDYGMLSGGASTNQVWGSTAGNIPASDIATCTIKYPEDGSEIPAAQAAAKHKPSTLVISLGMDSLSGVTEDSFVSSFTTLINDIAAQSPDTVIIVCSPSSIVADYSGADELTLDKVAALKEWIIKVCTDTGVYYADYSRDICDSTGTLGFNYASANGKTLNSAGLNQFLTYLRTHMP